MRDRIYLSPPHMGGKEMSFIQDAFDTNWIAPLGPHVEGFEKDIAQYIGSQGALALSSGTAGIHLALKYAGVTQGDYVFCSSLTFSGSCNPIMYEKAIPVFIDSEPDSWNMSPVALEKAFEWAKGENKLPKAVVIVNLYGQSADWDRLLPICERYGVPVIEDAAESLGSTYRGKQTGTFGYIGVFSFNGNKIITTSGGGMVVSNDLDALKKMKFWSTQSREPEKHYEHKEVGYNYRMSNICAAIGRGQMRVLHDRIGRKREIFESYKEAFKTLDCIEMMPMADYGQPNNWLTVITLRPDCGVHPTDIIEELEQENIESRPVWKPMHLQPVFQPYPFVTADPKVIPSEYAFHRGVCLPSGTKMTSDDIRLITDIIHQLCRKRRSR